MTESSKSDSEMRSRVCPVSRSRFLATRLRRLVHNPRKILGELIESGQTAIDLGCGPGYFAVAMAKIVGDKGQVIAIDLQEEMLDRLARMAQAAGVESRIRRHRCKADRIGLNVKADFALAFYVVHETADARAFLREVHDILRPGGRLLIVEPKLHVSAKEFEETVAMARSAGFASVASPAIALSRSTLFERTYGQARAW
jgi:ubiquinone/menaquinone biosynthesis C-methylase UbiE